LIRLRSRSLIVTQPILETDISNGRGPDTSNERLHAGYTEVLLSDKMLLRNQ
jgi:hypothetical protein